MPIITAKRADTCRRCDKDVAVGEKITYNGPGTVTHERCEPVTRNQGTRRSRRRGSPWPAQCTHEDYPCCGCER